MSQGGSNKKVSNSLLALSSGAILAVYAAGYTRTRSAADRFAVQAEERRPAFAVTRASVPPLASTAVASPVAPPRSERKREVAVRPAVTSSSSQPSPAAAEVSSATAEPALLPVETPVPTPSPVAEPAPVIAEQKAEPPAAAPAAAPKPVWKDGTYTGWGTSRHGDIQAAVVIEGGRIASATIAECLTRYSCSVISNLPPEVAQRQSPEVDSVSGATQSADAFYYAVVDALAKAK